MKKSFVLFVGAGLLGLFMAFGRQSVNVILQDAIAMPENGARPARAKILAALVGTWRNGDIATVEFYHTKTGEWSNSADNGMFLTIQPNGEYRLGAAAPVYLNSAEARYLLYQQGKVAVVDSQLVLSPNLSFTEIHEINTAPRQAERPSNECDLQPSAFLFRIVQAQGRPSLELVTATGDHMTLGFDGL